MYTLTEETGSDVVPMFCLFVPVKLNNAGHSGRAV
jgi:hypothetical protein